MNGVLYVMLVLGVNSQGEDDGEVITKRFLPGGTDVFRISAGDVGELVKIRVIVDPTGKNPNWLLSKVCPLVIPMTTLAMT